VFGLPYSTRRLSDLILGVLGIPFKHSKARIERSIITSSLHMVASGDESVRIRKLCPMDFKLGFTELISSPITLQQFTRFYYEICTQSNVYVMERHERATNRRELIATATLFIEEKTTHGLCRLAHLENVFVSEKSRGIGCGKTLIHFLIAEARSMGCYKIICTSTFSLSHYYNAMGFSEPHRVQTKIFQDNFRDIDVFDTGTPKYGETTKHFVRMNDSIRSTCVIRNIHSRDYDAGFTRLLGSKISRDFFEAYLKHVCGENHIVLVMEDEEGYLVGTCTVVIERKFTHGLCKFCHMEDLYLDINRASHGAHGCLLIQEALNVARSRECYRVDMALSDERTLGYYDGIFDQKDLIQQSILFPENFV